MNDFKNKDFHLREKEASLVLNKYPKSIPIIIYPKYDNIEKLKKNKYVIPNDLSGGHFFDIIRKQLNMPKETALFFFTDNNVLLSATIILNNLYIKEKNLDGYLYIYYSLENVFG